MTERIMVVLEIVNSKTDINGNRYFVMIATRVCDRATAFGRVAHGSNARGAICQLVGNWDGFIYSEREMPIREFNNRTGHWGYMGCGHDEIISNLHKGWGPVLASDVHNMTEREKEIFDYAGKDS